MLQQQQKSPYILCNKPAGDNDDILRNVGHLFDGQVAHPSEGLLRERTLEIQLFCLKHVGKKTNTDQINSRLREYYLTSLD